MIIYSVRKRRGQWVVCSDENVLLHFETYDEAVDTARGAVEVLSGRPPIPSDPSCALQTGEPADNMEKQASS